ncbi:unnamed protein product [Chrysodeixis includens]|uniref:Uncharacterized protein n=1 Tax=Chrysodeixis includens TaxID=689277 RepID=A0A9N8PZM1_CHRIL|nr:unnamed protein product [Chrysodeixis includens]
MAARAAVVRGGKVKIRKEHIQIYKILNFQNFRKTFQVAETPSWDRTHRVVLAPSGGRGARGPPADQDVVRVGAQPFCSNNNDCKCEWALASRCGGRRPARDL